MIVTSRKGTAAFAAMVITAAMSLQAQAADIDPAWAKKARLIVEGTYEAAKPRSGGMTTDVWHPPGTVRVTKVIRGTLPRRSRSRVTVVTIAIYGENRDRPANGDRGVFYFARGSNLIHFQPTAAAARPKTTVKPITSPKPAIPERAARATLIIVGRAAARAAPDHYYTGGRGTVNIRVEKVLKGSLSAREAARNEVVAYPRGGPRAGVLGTYYLGVHEGPPDGRYDVLHFGPVAKRPLASPTPPATSRPKVTTRGFGGLLCAKCSQIMGFTADMSRCRECRGAISSGSIRLCAACSRKLGKCEVCGVVLGKRPAAPPPKRPPRKMGDHPEPG